MEKQISSSCAQHSQDEALMMMAIHWHYIAPYMKKAGIDWVGGDSSRLFGTRHFFELDNRLVQNDRLGLFGSLLSFFSFFLISLLFHNPSSHPSPFQTSHVYLFSFKNTFLVRISPHLFWFFNPDTYFFIFLPSKPLSSLNWLLVLGHKFFFSYWKIDHIEIIKMAIGNHSCT